MDEKLKLPISFEFFPPKTEHGLLSLVQCAEILSKWEPEYFSVTFGAGGSTQENTLKIVRSLTQKKLTMAPHLTCVGLTKPQIRDLLNQYRAMGITRIVALRGDEVGENTSQSCFKFANELVEFIRLETGNHFFIEVAAYPEFHPQAKSVSSDLNAFKRKVAAGANRAITQYFYNVEAYFRFQESCAAHQISIPVVPGIMPIRDVQQLIRFSKLCGADLPLWLIKRLASYEGDAVAVQQFGIDVVTRLCERLIIGGAPGLHFYTLNNLEPTVSILRILGVERSITASLEYLETV
ncbi:MAG: methylenetetrahydrofolate reductase [NAD(P)H] [Coxiella sp. RIFCSPHIGHO2_12_FULL_44_14]|nr:MAG: methylenetetrahydrofolate reductase [NAD(P)H] [Coxiella sp. RIFCSPHIGHO2_12_FULL_44_14]